jgi:hypothetical protein
MAILDVKDNTFLSKIDNEGVPEGFEKGVERGIEEHLRNTRRRFGPLPAALEAKIRSGARSDVERWMLRLMDCSTAGQVLSDTEA